MRLHADPTRSVGTDDDLLERLARVPLRWFSRMLDRVAEHRCALDGLDLSVVDDPRFSRSHRLLSSMESRVIELRKRLDSQLDLRWSEWVTWKRRWHKLAERRILRAAGISHCDDAPDAPDRKSGKAAGPFWTSLDLIYRAMLSGPLTHERIVLDALEQLQDRLREQQDLIQQGAPPSKTDERMPELRRLVAALRESAPPILESEEAPQADVEKSAVTRKPDEPEERHKPGDAEFLTRVAIEHLKEQGIDPSASQVAKFSGVPAPTVKQTHAWKELVMKPRRREGRTRPRRSARIINASDLEIELDDAYASPRAHRSGRWSDDE